MSIVAKLKEFEDANKALTAELAAAKDSAAQLAKDHAAALEAQTAAHTSALAEANTKNTELAATVAAHVATITDLTANAENISKDLAAAVARADKAEKKLGNPAFADAVEGQNPIKETLSSEDALETDEKFYARYSAESDPAKKTKMWKAHMTATGRESAIA